mgnify:CR=1 FL=1
MARVPEEELERLKREVSLERLAEAKGVALTRVGKDLRGRTSSTASAAARKARRSTG